MPAIFITIDCEVGAVYIIFLNFMLQNKYRVLFLIFLANFQLFQKIIRKWRKQQMIQLKRCQEISRRVSYINEWFYNRNEQSYILIIMQNQQISIEHTFLQTGLNPFICRLLSHKKYINPTPIQYFSIKTGIDHPQFSLICRSKSGTGKTIAYLSLLMNFLTSINAFENKTYSIILLPTRQLAVQVYRALRQILDGAGQTQAPNQSQKQLKKRLCQLNIMLTIGGISFEDDRKRYRQNASNVIICTVGRIWEMIKSNIIIMGKQMLIIFDQGDKLLSNVDEKLNKVINILPKAAKWLIYSATYSHKIILDVAKAKQKCMYVQTLFKNNELDVVITDKISAFVQSHPKVVTQASLTGKNPSYPEQNPQNTQNLRLENIKKYQIKINPQQNDSIFDCKIKVLCQLLSELKYQKCLVFVEKKSFLEQISQCLNNFQHVLIHGSLSQAARFRMMNRINNTKIIIASDLLSRGIDIRLDLVILFDARQSDTFWHRIGRTGRYGRTGVAISLDQIEDKEWLSFNREEVNLILNQIQLFQKKQWYGGHLTQIGRWQQFDPQKQAKNNYKYFDEDKMIKQISIIQSKIKNNQKNSEQNSSRVWQWVKNIRSKQQLQKAIKQKVLQCRQCMELMKATTQLTGYKFQILSYVKE